MKAAVFGAGGLSIEDRSDPEPGPRDVVVQVRRCGISEIDVALTSGGRFDVAFGAVLGSECSGEVVAVGSAIERLRSGDRVAGVPSRGCGRCAACACGRRPLCTDASAWSGGFAELVRVPEPAAFKLSEDASYAEGALLAPLATALRSLAVLRDKPPRNVLVLGGCSIALSVAFWVRRIWAGAVLVQSTSSRSATVGRRLGLVEIAVPAGASTEELLEASNARPEVVVECLGAPGALQRAVELVASQGSVLSLGLGIAPDPFSPRLASAKGISFHFPYGCSFAEFADAAAAVRDSGQHLAQMVTAVVGLEELPRTFEALHRPHDEIKVQLEFP